MKQKRVTDFPPGRNYRWWHNIPRESMERIGTMLQSADNEMKALGIIGFYHICKVWEEDKDPLWVQGYTFDMRYKTRQRPNKRKSLNMIKYYVVMARFNEIKRRMGI
jgi:hypothetical protein